jgi:ATP/maltotriose-dependent transcriptional regulator MalT/DNA-binding SARP family transcriptional activator
MSTLPKHFLRTKLMPPRLATGLLERPRLLERLRKQVDLPVTILSANAGCGKTTLVNEFVRHAAIPYVWYQVDTSDLDLAVFFAHLVQGLQSVHPGFGNVVLGYMTETDDLWSKAEQLADVFLNEVFERIEEKTIIVLDDFHNVDASEAVCVAIDRIVKYLPDVLHIVITTRSMPNLAVTRLKSKGMVGILGRQDLLFTQQEVEQLFGRIFERELPAEVISRLHETTEGWITALQLVQQSLKRSAALGYAGATDELITALRQSEADIFDYFAEEVLEEESPEVRLLLGRLSLLDRIDPAMYKGALQGSPAQEELESIARRNIFLTQMSEPGIEAEYRFHPLFRSFLQRWLETQIGRDGIQGLHRAYGDWCRQAGRWDAALYHYGEASEELAADTLAQHGLDLVRMGCHEAVKRGFDRLPRALFITRPVALNVRADIALTEGDRQFARSLFERAASIAGDAGQPEVVADALRGLAYIARHSGDCSLASELAQSAIDIAQTGGGVRARCLNIIGLCRFAAHDVAGAIESWQSALGEARAAGEERFARVVLHNLGLPYSQRGEFDEALRWFSQIADAREVAQRDDLTLTSPFPQEAIGYLNIGRGKVVQGKLDEAESSLNRAMDRCRMFNMRATSAETLEALGNLYRERGDYSRALGFYDEASRAYREAGLALTESELLDERATLFLYMGRLADAQVDIELYSRARLSSGASACSTALITMGRIQMAAGERSQAETSLREAAALASGAELHYNETRALTSLARLLWVDGRASEAITLLGRASRLSALHDYSFWMAQESSRCPDLFGQASATNSSVAAGRAGWGTGPPEFALETSPGHAPINHQDSLETELDRQPCDLSISLFGPVSVRRAASEPMPQDAWRLAKSLHILCYIASRPNHRARKDALIEAFWSGADPETIEKNFHPTISHLRKALNSGQVLKKDFILYRDGAYSLNPRYKYCLDIEDFDARLALSREAERRGDLEASTELLSEAIGIYRGDFLEELYYDWADEQRNFYQDLYLEALSGLLSYSDRRGDYASAIRYGQMILRRDPYREDIHCQVMEAYARSGNRGAAIEQFANLKETLGRELGVSPLHTTVAKYESLIK